MQDLSGILQKLITKNDRRVKRVTIEYTFKSHSPTFGLRAFLENIVFLSTRIIIVITYYDIIIHHTPNASSTYYFILTALFIVRVF